MRNTLTCALLARSSVSCSTLVHAEGNANGRELNGAGHNRAGDNGDGGTRPPCNAARDGTLIDKSDDLRIQGAAHLTGQRGSRFIRTAR